MSRRVAYLSRREEPGVPRERAVQWGFREALWDGAKALELEAPGFESWAAVYRLCDPSKTLPPSECQLTRL